MKNERSKRLLHMFLAILGVAILTIVDQWTKGLAFHSLKGKTDLTLIPGWFSLHYLENRGAAFGIFQNQQSFFYVLTIAVLLVLLLIYWNIPEHKRYLPFRITMIVLMAGAVGNLIDRMVHQYVIDFFYLEIIDFPVFNVADIYVTFSVIFLIILILFYYKEEELQFFKKKRTGEEKNGKPEQKQE